jgi:hypothetical protein
VSDDGPVFIRFCAVDQLLRVILVRGPFDLANTLVRDLWPVIQVSVHAEHTSGGSDVTERCFGKHGPKARHRHSRPVVPKLGTHSTVLVLIVIVC